MFLLTREGGGGERWLLETQVTLPPLFLFSPSRLTNLLLLPFPSVRPLLELHHKNTWAIPLPLSHQHHQLPPPPLLLRGRRRCCVSVCLSISPLVSCLSFPRIRPFPAAAQAPPMARARVTCAGRGHNPSKEGGREEGDFVRREEGDSSKSASYSIGTAKSGPLSLTHTGEGCRAQVERFFFFLSLEPRRKRAGKAWV